MTIVPDQHGFLIASVISTMVVGPLFFLYKITLAWNYKV